MTSNTCETEHVSRKRSVPKKDVSRVGLWAGVKKSSRSWSEQELRVSSEWKCSGKRVL